MLFHSAATEVGGGGEGGRSVGVLLNTNKLAPCNKGTDVLSDSVCSPSVSPTVYSFMVRSFLIILL